MKLSKIAWRNLARNRRRTFFSIFTIVIAGLVGFFMLSLIAGMKIDMKNNILTYYTGVVQIINSDYEKYEYLNPLHFYVKDQKKVRAEIEKIEGVTMTVPRITVGGKIFIDDDVFDEIPAEEFTAMGMGIDLILEKDLMDPESLLLKENGGRLPNPGSDEVAMGGGLAKKCGLEIGDKFSFLTGTAGMGGDARTFTLTGILRFTMGGLSDSNFIVPFKTMQALVHMDEVIKEGGEVDYDAAKEILVLTEDPEIGEIEWEKINTLLAEDKDLSYLTTKFWKGAGEFYAMMSMGEVMYNFIALFFLLMGATVIINTTMMAVYERYHEIGVMGAMGMTPGELVRLFFLESLFASMIATVFCLGLGIAMVKGLEVKGIDFSEAMGSMDMEMSTILYPKLVLKQVFAMALYTTFIPALVTLIPCIKAAKIQPIDAIRSI